MAGRLHRTIIVTSSFLLFNHRDLVILESRLGITLVLLKGGLIPALTVIPHHQKKPIRGERGIDASLG